MWNCIDETPHPLHVVVVNAKKWQEKKQQLTAEAASLQRQIDGVRKKLDAVLVKLNFMNELEGEPEVTTEEVQASLLDDAPTGVIITKSPPLEAVAKKYAEQLKKFTKENLVETIIQKEPGLKFNPKSFDRILIKLLKENRIAKITKDGAAFVYEFKPF